MYIVTIVNSNNTRYTYKYAKLKTALLRVRIAVILGSVVTIEEVSYGR